MKLKSLSNILLLYLSMFSVRNKDVYVFGSWLGKKFSDNPKYMFLKCMKNKEIRCIWITKNKLVYDDMKNLNYEVYMANSVKGIYYQLKAGTYFTCTGSLDVSAYLMGNASHINLWHGIPLKKIMYDDKINNRKEDKSIKKYFRNIKDSIYNFPFRKEYIISTSDETTKIYKSAFRTTNDKILQLGQPRNDVFFNDDLDDKDFPLKYKNKKVILYMPTHRNEGKTKININDLFDLGKINELCLNNDIIFLIKKHFYHGNEIEKLDKYSNIEDITNLTVDSQILLKYADILITDYSSCFFDFLLLNKPIIFYCYDINNYVINDREFYFDYNAITPGKKVSDFQALYSFLNEIVVSYEDGYEEKRNEVKNILYSKDNQYEVSQKILDYVRNNI